MNHEYVMEVEHLSKKFCREIKKTILYGTADVAKNMVGIRSKTAKLRKGEFWALDDVNFNLKKGEVLGIIGKNGSGKSTLLRLVNGIFPPDKGEIRIKGHVGGLIALGAGFHPHLSGRENIYVNGSILGMKKKEIDGKLEEIIAFADIGDFLEAPVSTYSSGMKVRLGFSIAIYSKNEICLIDEVLSVGDLAFRNKCLRKIAEMRDQGRSIFFVSHQLEMVKFISDRVMLMDKGKIVNIGTPDAMIAEYITLLNEGQLDRDEKDIKQEQGKLFLTEDVTFLEAGVVDKKGKKIKKVKYGEDIRIFYEFIPHIEINKPVISIGITDSRGNNLFLDSNLEHNNIRTVKIKKDKKHRVDITLKKVNMLPGVYRLLISLNCIQNFQKYHKISRDEDNSFTVVSKDTSSFLVEDPEYAYDGSRGSIGFESDWNVEIEK
ncbi:MAG: ABC transporter ATP-binding protein [bacterium]|nr:ABC transporter ATP-binding protein [bacterium]